MTSDAQKKSGYLIPDDITDHDLLCVQMFIPNDILYIGAFTGQLNALATWFTWEKSYEPGDTRATQAAAYWRYLIDTYLCIQFNKPLEDDGMPCCDDNEVLTRFTPEGVFQTSTDGGTTWVDNPAQDPRNNAVAAAPLPGEDSDNKRCAAADNIRDVFTQYRDNLNGLLSASPTLVSIIAGILAFLAVITGVSGAAIGISVILMGLAAALLALSEGEILTLIDATVLNNFRCTVYCRLETSGQITYDNWLGLLQDIAEQYDGFAETFFYQTVNGMGYIGLSNAGTIGVASASDCSGCDCEPCTQTVGTTLDVYFGNVLNQDNCNLQIEAIAESTHFAIGITWDGTHLWRADAATIIAGDPGAQHWQWYLADGSGPFFGAFPTGVLIQTLSMSGDPGMTFSVSIDVEDEI